VKLVFAYECYADQDVFEFLKQERPGTLKGLHSFGQGEVVNDVFIKGKAQVGMVDEDPGKPHHPHRERVRVISRSDDIEVRRDKSGRCLILLIPALEECFLRSWNGVGLSKLPFDAPELRRRLNTPGGACHQEFRRDLRALHERSVETKRLCFTTELVRVVHDLT
jgi:hypothetical protein